MITKNDIVLAAYEELRISGITAKPSPEAITSAIRRLDSMVLAWQNKNLCLSYIRSESYSNINTNQDSGINDTDMLALVMNLAKLLWPSFTDRPLSRDTSAQAKEAYDNLFSVVVPARETDTYQPLGSGRPFGDSYTYRYRYQLEEVNAPDNCDTLDLKVGQTDFFSIDFNSYLLEGNTIASYTIDDGQGVSIPTSAEIDGVITVEAQGLTAGYAPIKITVTSTPSGRVDPQTINFNVTAT